MHGRDRQAFCECPHLTTRSISSAKYGGASPVYYIRQGLCDTAETNIQTTIIAKLCSEDEVIIWLLRLIIVSTNRTLGDIHAPVSQMSKATGQ